MKRVTTFKYLGSTLAEDGELDAEVSHRVQSGWMNWKKVSRVLCDKKNESQDQGKCLQDDSKTNNGARSGDMVGEEGA